MTKLQRLKRAAAKFVPVIGHVSMSIGAGAVVSMIWRPDIDTGTRVLATTWILLAVYFDILAAKFSKLADTAATREHQDGYLRGVVSMILAHRRWYETGDSDYMQTVVTSANDGLVDWRDQWVEPMKDEFERLDNE